MKYKHQKWQSPEKTIIYVQNCSVDSDEIETSEFETYLSLNKSDFDFARDWDNLSETDKNTFRSAKKRMNFTFDKNGICKTKWTSSSQVNISEELFDCYYTYSDQYGMWGADNPAVFSHYLEGGYIQKEALLPKSSTGSSQYLITLTGPPPHVVVFKGSSSGSINYYDPQTGKSKQCSISDIADVYKATGFNHY
jgi:hypothetical protein